MGACMSSSNPGIEVSEDDKRMHREAEKALKEVRPICCSSANSNFTSAVTGKIEDGLTGQGTRFRSIASLLPVMSHYQVLLLGSGDSGKSTILKVRVVLLRERSRPAVEFTVSRIANAVYPQSPVLNAGD